MDDGDDKERKNKVKNIYQSFRFLPFCVATVVHNSRSIFIFLLLLSLFLGLGLLHHIETKLMLKKPMTKDFNILDMRDSVRPKSLIPIYYGGFTMKFGQDFMDTQDINIYWHSRWIKKEFFQDIT